MICVGVKMSQVGKELIRKLKKEIHLKESLHEYSDFMNQNYKGFAYIRLALCPKGKRKTSQSSQIAHFLYTKLLFILIFCYL